MKKIYSFLIMPFIGMALSLGSCSDDNGGNNNSGNGGNNNGGGQEPIEQVHYDIWVGLEQNAMGRFGTLLVKNVNSLEGNGSVTFEGEGCDVTATFGKTESSIIRGQYYYAVDAVNEDRYVKYRIMNNQLERVAQRQFGSNTYEAGKYTHAWLDDNTLVILATNGEANEVLWTKLNATTMNILAEGNLGLAGHEGHDVTKFTTSGLAAYRASDNKIIYAFKHNPGRKQTAPPYFYVAFINATDMTVESIVKEARAEEMAGSAYGELRQHKMFFDEDENLYIACNTKIEGAEDNTCQYGSLLRIPKDATAFDSYQGFRNKQGKIVTVDYMGDNKALLYLQDPEHTGTGTDNSKYEGWGNGYNCYYAMLDLTTDELTEFQYDGKPLPFCSGTFSQRSFVLGNKAFIGVNPETSNPMVYVYDMDAKTVTPGISIQEGYIFTRINYITD